MENEFYIKYKTFSKNKIFDILINKDDYQNDAVNAAKKIIRENNWDSELKEIIEIQKQNYNNEIAEKAEYYKNIIEFQKDNFYFNIKIADVPKFEAELIKENIDFYREDKNIGPQLDYFPTEKYYFKKKDIEKADNICKRINLITQPYSEHKQFFRFEVKVILIVIIIAIFISFIFSRFIK